MPRTLKNQPGVWLPIPWEEYVGKDGSHGATFATGWDGGSQATFQILINWQDLLDAEVALLGTAYFNGIFLHRTLPARHPYKPAYVCERILSAQPVRWSAKLNLWQEANITGTTGAPLSEYAYFLLTLGFHVPKYRILNDASLQTIYGGMFEWHRWCEVTPRVNYFTISREKGEHGWIWADGTTTQAGGNPPTLNSQVVAPVGQVFLRKEIHVKWRRVPRRGLFANHGDSDMFNANLDSVWGKINSTTTLWAAPGNASSGVLRFVTAEATPIGSPFDSIVQGLTPFDINTYYDVDMTFDWFDPPFGDSAFRGHNLAPNPGDNFWYLITTTNGQTIYQTADLSLAFTLSLV